MSYDSLSCGSPTRLARLRHKHGADWRRWRSKLSAHYPGRAESIEGDCIALENSTVDAWRDAGMSEKILSLRHRGWFADTIQDETYAGQVWQLPARNGSPVYVAGYRDLSGYTVLDVTRGYINTFNELREAAHAADELARINAERDREHNERWQEARDADEARDAERDTLRQARQEARETIEAMRETAPGTKARAALCKSLRLSRSIMARALRGIETCRKRIADLDMEGEF